MTGEGVKKKRDPIFSVCFVVFIVACVGVVGSFVDQHYIHEDETVAAYGDKVVVNYTGSLYAYYGEENAVVFDTSYENIGKDDSVAKISSFSKSSYSTFDVTIGSKGALEMFENAIVGHKVGDTFKVMIPKGEGYTATNTENTIGTAMSIPANYTVPKAAFDEQYPDVDLEAGQYTSFTTTYGWTAQAMYNGNSVLVSNYPDVGKTYEYYGNEDSRFGKISFAVTSVSDNKVNFTVSFTDTKAVGDGIQMVEFEQYDGTTWFVTSLGSGEFTYKTCDAQYNETLYFEISIVSIN